MSKTKKKQKTMEELLEEALVPKEEQPYEVPGNWVWTKLGFIGEIGSSKRVLKADWKDEGIPFFRAREIVKLNKNEEIENGIFISENLYFELKDKYGVPNENDLLITAVGTIGVPYIVKSSDKFYFKDASVIWYKNKLNLDIKYIKLFYETSFARNQIKNMSAGTTVDTYTISNAKQTMVPLPPKKEQIRIANKVERLLNKIDEAKQLIEEAKETFEHRREAILDKAFRGELTEKWRKENPNVESAEVLLDKIREERKTTKQKGIEGQLEELNEAYKLPSGWKWVRLSEILKVNPPKEKIEAPDDQICSFVPMASVSDVTGKIVEIEKRKFSDVKRGYTLFKDNDVIFAKITPCMENGKSAIIKGMKNGFGYGSTEFYVLRASKHINEQLIHFLVRSKKFRAEAKRVMTGAVGQQRVPKKFIEDYLFPLPPKMEQEQIVSLLNSLFKKEEEAMQVSYLEETLGILKKSILYKAFRGELDTNDPAEESAIELLKEVLQGK